MNFDWNVSNYKVVTFLETFLIIGHKPIWKWKWDNSNCKTNQNISFSKNLSFFPKKVHLLGEGAFLPRNSGLFLRKILCSPRKLLFSPWNFFIPCTSCFLRYFICFLRIFFAPWEFHFAPWGIDITNLPSFVGSYEFHVKSLFHKFVQKLYEFYVMVIWMIFVCI